MGYTRQIRNICTMSAIGPAVARPFCGVGSCRPVPQRMSVAGRAPDCGTLTVKPVGWIVRQYNFRFLQFLLWGVGEWNLGWCGGWA
jgi:hypothetical protein